MPQNPQPGSHAGMSLPEKVIEHITLTDSALKNAAAMEKSAAAKQAQVDALIPQVVDTMIRHERIMPSEREKLAAMLRDPAKALELMIKVAGHRNAEEMAKLGAPTGQTKVASNGRPVVDPAASLTSPHVGARTTMLKQSSVSLFKGLGLPVPTE